jgi:hypothetical protein
LWVWNNSHNKKKILPFISIAGSYYNRDGECLLRGTAWLYRNQFNVTYREAVPCCTR